MFGLKRTKFSDMTKITGMIMLKLFTFDCWTSEKELNTFFLDLMKSKLSEDKV